MKTVLVTGAAGFLGSHLVDGLLLTGHRVVGIDNLFRGKEENLPTNDNFEFYRIDLSSEYKKIKNIIEYEKPVVVYHYAAVNGTKYFYDMPFFVLNHNILITQNVLKAIKDSTVKKIVYASSSEVYGHDPEIPTKESQKILLNIDTERDSYSSSKAIGEFYVKLFSLDSNVDFLIVRIFNTYGSRMDNSEYGQVIPEFIRKISSDKTFTIIGSGKHTRSFCHVSDHVKIVIELSKNINNKIVNVGSNQEITINELAETMHFLLGKVYDPKYLPERSYDTMRRCPAISKLQMYLKNHVFLSLKDGLTKTIGWYAHETEN